MRRRHGWVALVVILTAWGCGTEAGIFADGESGSGAGASTGNGGETGTGGDPTTGTGGDPTTTGTGGDPTTTGTGGAPTTTGTGGDPSTTSTGVGGDMIPPVNCGGNVTCKVSDDGACCWDNYGFYGPPQGECVQGSVADDGCQTFSPQEPGQPGAETRVECQSNIQCGAGETCCGALESAFAQGQQVFFYESLTCQQNCSGQTEVPLCDPNEANPCPQGGTCQQSQLLPTGYFVCGN